MSMNQYTIPQFIVDAFTDTVFKGNPAAVCLPPRRGCPGLHHPPPRVYPQWRRLHLSNRSAGKIGQFRGLRIPVFFRKKINTPHHSPVLKQ